jgi:hypothetical protein
MQGFDTEAPNAQLKRDVVKHQDSPDKYINLLLKSKTITDSASEDNVYLASTIAAGLGVDFDYVRDRIRKFYRYE